MPEHAAELGDDPPTAPLLFGKFTNTLIGPGEPIVIPPGPATRRWRFIPATRWKSKLKGSAC